jgi:class 3 adenylate cyclase
VCGVKLGAPEAAEVRKTVTIVFCDVTGSTEREAVEIVDRTDFLSIAGRCSSIWARSWRS